MFYSQATPSESSASRAATRRSLHARSRAASAANSFGEVFSSATPARMIAVAAPTRQSSGSASTSQPSSTAITGLMYE